MSDPQILLQTALTAAAAGAQALAPFIHGTKALAAQEKSNHDFVTAADLASERAIVAAIRAAFPTHEILGEEETKAELQSAGPLWIVDPLDGTTNFIHGFPVFSVSVACAVAGQVVAGVVLDPNREETFAAARGHGATLNLQPIQVSRRPSLKDALIGTGFPFRRLNRIDAYLASFKAVVQDTAGIRRAGSAALDLAAVACGRFDGFWEEGLGPWDMAAGALIIEEAGGLVTDFHGQHRFLESGTIVAGPPSIHGPLQALIEPHLG